MCGLGMAYLHTSINNSCSGSLAVEDAISSIWEHLNIVPFLSASSLLATHALNEQEAGIPRNVELLESLVQQLNLSQDNKLFNSSLNKQTSAVQY